MDTLIPKQATTLIIKASSCYHASIKISISSIISAPMKRTTLQYCRSTLYNQQHAAASGDPRTCYALLQAVIG
eukprot:441754-Pelagomonas_calceolata.AAC.2